MHSNSPWWREAAIESPRSRPATSGQGRALGATLSFWALMGFTLILLLAPQERFPALAPLRIALLSAALAVLAHVYHRLSRGLPVIDFSPAITLVFALVAWALVTVPFSHWPGGSVAYLLEMFSKTVIVFVLLTQVIDNLAKLRWITWGLVLMSIPLAMTTVANFMSGVQIEGTARVAGYSAGLTENPNDMALMLNLILCLCIALLLDARRRTVKVLLACIAGLLVVAIIATFSRAGFLTLGVIGLSYAWFLRTRPQRVWVPVLLALVVLALPLVPASYFERIDTISNIEADSSGSAQTRLQDMKVALKLGITNPLVGAGIGMDELVMNEARGETWTKIHNVYLQYLVELGLPGLVLFLLLYHKCLAATGEIRGRHGAKADPGSLFHIAQGLRVSLLAFAVAALFHPVAYHFYFYFFAGLAVAAGRILHDEDKGEIL